MAISHLCFPLGFVSLLLLGYLCFTPESALSFSALKLRHRFDSQQGQDTISAQHLQRLVSHDARRNSHRNLLQDTHLPLGGHADPYAAGLYFAELEIGTPPSTFYAQVDTGSDLLWLSCDSCRACPTRSNLGINLQPYSPARSRTSHRLVCGQDACGANCFPGKPCAYKLSYADGSISEGYYVQDILELPSVENQSFAGANASILFGCTVIVNRGLQNTDDNPDQAVGGILGLGQSNASLIQQLALQQGTPRVFAHCLEGAGHGGGILVIGKVINPGLVFTPLVSNRLHYNVNLKSIDVDRLSLKIDTTSQESGEVYGTIFDSGTTLAYLPESVYLALLQEILVARNAPLVQADDEFSCIIHDGSLDDKYPTITFTFDGGATMTIKPHDYFIQVHRTKDVFCFGFLSSPASSPSVTILGDIMLKNRLVVYDLEKQQIGWMDYNCSSNVTVMSSRNTPEKVFGTAIGRAVHSFSCKETSITVLLSMLFILIIT